MRRPILPFALALLALPAALTAQEAPPPAALPPELLGELAALEAELAGLEADPAVSATAEAAVPAPPPASRAALEAEAFAELEATGRAPIVALPGGALFPFGHTVPTLVCLPDRACDIELQAGEVVDGLALGDAARWEAAQFFEGEAPRLAPHVVLKPHEPDLRTNLVLVTSRRTYHLELVSPPEEELEEGAGEEAPVAYHHHTAFWYPEAWAQRLRTEAEIAQAEATRARQARVLPEALSGGLSFTYDLIQPRRRSRRLPWEPVTVFDDGKRTYIVLPPAARARPLPAVLAIEGGERQALNAQLHGDWLVIPRLVDSAELVYGTGEARRSLTVVREGR